MTLDLTFASHYIKEHAQGAGLAAARAHRLIEAAAELHHTASCTR